MGKNQAPSFLDQKTAYILRLKYVTVPGRFEFVVSRKYGFWLREVITCWYSIDFMRNPMN